MVIVIDMGVIWSALVDAKHGNQLANYVCPLLAYYVAVWPCKHVTSIVDYHKLGVIPKLLCQLHALKVRIWSSGQLRMRTQSYQSTCVRFRENLELIGDYVVVVFSRFRCVHNNFRSHRECIKKVYRNLNAH